MSQMLNPAGGQPQGTGYHGVSQGHTSLSANVAAVQPSECTVFICFAVTYDLLLLVCYLWA